MKINISIIFSKKYLILYAIIFLGALIRLQGVFSNSFAFTYDVGRDMLALWDIIYQYKIPLIGQTTGLPGVFYGPWWYYSLILPFILFLKNPQGIAFTMALIGVLTIPLGYVLGKRISNNFLGICFASILCVSPIMISLSSQIWNPNIIPLFILILLFLLEKIYFSKRLKQRYYFLLGLILAFILDLEIVFGLLLSIGIIVSTIIIAKKKISLKSIYLFILGGLIILLPRIAFEFRHGFLMTKSFISFFVGGESSNIVSLIDALVNRMNIFFDQFNSTLAADNKNLGFLLLLFIFSMIIIGYKKADDKIKSFIKISFITVLTFFIGTVFFSHDIWPHYLVGLPVFYILVFSISIYLLKDGFINSAFSVLILIILFVLNLNPIALYKGLTQPIWEGNAAVYRNQLAVIDYVYEQAKGNGFKFVVYTPPVHDYTYQYLFKWYGFNKYHYLPSVQSNLSYFILEPDFENPSRLTEWLKFREGDGKIIKQDVVRGGIIVQTRVNENK